MIFHNQMLDTTHWMLLQYSPRVFIKNSYSLNQLQPVVCIVYSQIQGFKGNKQEKKDLIMNQIVRQSLELQYNF